MSEAIKYPPRFTLSGVLLNVFQAPAGEKDGKRWGGDYRVQLMSADHLRNGETKLVPTDVSIGSDANDFKGFKGKVGQMVSLPVTVFVIDNQLRCSLAEEGGR